MRVLDRGNGPETEVSHEIYLDGKSVDEVGEYLRQAVEQSGLTDVRLNIDIEYSYGDSFLKQSIVGWRPATEFERRQAAQERQAAERQQREWEERQAAQLRDRRPDLFA